MKAIIYLIFIFQGLESQAMDFHVSQGQFTYSSQADDFTMLSWAPLTPFGGSGIDVSFHGLAYDDCNGISNCVGGNCFRKNSFLAQPDRVFGFTGISNGNSYSPVCPYDPSRLISNSFVAIQDIGSVGEKGIGVYTHTGKKPFAANNSFLQPKHHHIFGTYVSFPVHKRGEMLPFSSNCLGEDCAKRISMRVWTKQAIKSVKNNGSSQTQQKMAIVLENRKAAANLSTPARIEITPFTHCAGSNCPSTSKVNFNLGDPYQGGMPFVGGALFANGTKSYMTSKFGMTDIWVSRGAATESVPTNLSWFAYEISWVNLKNTLIHITKLRLNKSSVSASEVESVFGVGWDNRFNWRLKYVRVAQEVFNPDWISGNQATLGGRVPWIQIDAITKSEH